MALHGAHLIYAIQLLFWAAFGITLAISRRTPLQQAHESTVAATAATASHPQVLLIVHALAFAPGIY